MNVFVLVEKTTAHMLAAVSSSLLRCSVPLMEQEKGAATTTPCFAQAPVCST